MRTNGLAYAWREANACVPSEAGKTNRDPADLTGLHHEILRIASDAGIQEPQAGASTYQWPVSDAKSGSDAVRATVVHTRMNRRTV